MQHQRHDGQHSGQQAGCDQCGNDRAQAASHQQQEVGEDLGGALFPEGNVICHSAAAVAGDLFHFQIQVLNDGTHNDLKFCLGRIDADDTVQSLQPILVHLFHVHRVHAQACGAVVDAGYVLFAAQTFDDLFGKGRHLSLGDLCHKIYPPFWGAFLPLMRCGRSHWLHYNTMILFRKDNFARKLLSS